MSTSNWILYEPISINHRFRPNIIERFLITTHQRSCGKVVFLHLCVILFTGEGLSTLDGDPPEERTPGQRPPGTDI